jgi:hypothetical protein
MMRSVMRLFFVATGVMRMRRYVVVTALASIVLGSAAAGAGVERSSVAKTSLSARSQSPAQADGGKDAPPADGAPLTRDEILKQGPAALEQNCTQCHLSEKWEGTSRDREGWAAIVNEMARLIAEAQMPPMSEKTAKLVVDYLTLTRPQ